MSELHKLAEALGVTYPVAPEGTVGLLMFKNGDDVVDMIHHPIEKDSSEPGWAFVLGEVIKSLTRNVDTIVWETPDGCWETRVLLRRGLGVTVGPSGTQGGTTLYWQRCQRQEG